MRDFLRGHSQTVITRVRRPKKFMQYGEYYTNLGPLNQDTVKWVI